MNISDYFVLVLSLGPLKIIYDVGVWAFIIIRFRYFVHNRYDNLLSSIYLAALFSAIYASSLGFVIDIVIDEYDSEFRILSAVVAGYFFTRLALAFQTHYNSSLFLSDNKLINRLNFGWLAFAIISFIILEAFLGQPAVLDLHTEGFNINGNQYLGVGRAVVRSYLVFTITYCCLALIRYIKLSPARDARFRLRAWSGLGVLVTSGIHYLVIAICSLLAGFFPDQQNLVSSGYEQFAIINLIIAGISVVILASPRSILDRIANGYKRIQNYIKFGKLDWLRYELAKASFQMIGTKTGLPFVIFMRTQDQTYQISQAVIAISDCRRLLLPYVSQHDLKQSIEKAQKRQDYRNRYSVVVLTEAVALTLAIEKSKTALESPQAGSFIFQTEFPAKTLDELIDFFSEVSDAMKWLRTNKNR
ncbi:MAG: hypothetical protein K8L97_31255 [Anaerolineae bacterium]|nr:hypothetical protein [Anaerolineae bacterium]